ncbi:MAG: hypothetical protein ABFD86_05480 [Bryobacteraceae bacterium]
MNALRLFGLGTVLAVSAAAQPYVQVTTVKVKSGLMPAFTEVMQKFIQANQKHKGSTWIAGISVFGEWNKVKFFAVRDNLAAVEEANKAFDAALVAALGREGYGKLTSALGGMVADSWRSDLSRMRPKLGYLMPDDKAGLLKMFGQSRWLMLMVVQVRPPAQMEYLEGWSEYRKVLERSGSRSPIGVSTALTGPAVVSFTSWAKMLGDWDIKSPMKPPAKEELEKLRDLSRKGMPLVQGSEVEIYRLAPSLSNPAQEIIEADPAFWTPKPPAPPKPKPPAAKK